MEQTSIYETTIDYNYSAMRTVLRMINRDFHRIIMIFAAILFGVSLLSIFARTFFGTMNNAFLTILFFFLPIFIGLGVLLRLQLFNKSAKQFSEANRDRYTTVRFFEDFMQIQGESTQDKSEAIVFYKDVDALYENKEYIVFLYRNRTTYLHVQKSGDEEGVLEHIKRSILEEITSRKERTKTDV